MPQQLDERSLDLVAVDVVDQRPVDLDHVRAQLGHPAQTRVASARVVQGDHRTGGPQTRQQNSRGSRIGDLGVLGELEHETSEIRAVQERVEDLRAFQQVRADVDRQEAVLGELAKPSDRRTDHPCFECRSHAKAVGGGEPNVG